MANATCMPVRRMTSATLSAAAAPHLMPAGAHDDGALVAACLAGTPGAADRLVARHAPGVQAAVRRFLALRCPGRLDLVEDVTHDVFVALLRDDAAKLRQYSGRNGCSLGGWLRVVAVRLTIDTLRRDRRLPSLDDERPEMRALQRRLATEAAGPEQEFEGREIAGRLAAAVARLAPTDRLLAELHVVRGAALADVARTLGLSANAAYIRKSRLLQRLRRALTEHR